MPTLMKYRVYSCKVAAYLKLRICNYRNCMSIIVISGYQQGYGYEYGSPYQPNRPVYPQYGPDGDRYV